MRKKINRSILNPISSLTPLTRLFCKMGHQHLDLSLGHLACSPVSL